MANQQQINLYKDARVENLSLGPILLTIDNWNGQLSFLSRDLELSSIIGKFYAVS